MAILANGRVVALDDDCVWVETVRRSSCDSCSARRGCGHRLLASAGASQHLLAVTSGVGTLAVGDQVEIAIHENALLAGVGWAYLSPLLTLIVGLACGAALGGDAAAAVGALVGLGVGCAALRWRSRHLDGGFYRPRVVRRATGEHCAAETLDFHTD